jgi:heme/copper-type cytochrome/quinol oxidase subunit 1
MNRTTGTSVLVFGIVLGVIGAIMYWAITANTDGFNINTAGLILFWVGVGTTLIGLVLIMAGSRSTSVRRTDTTAGGGYQVEEEHRTV